MGFFGNKNEELSKVKKELEILTEDYKNLTETHQELVGRFSVVVNDKSKKEKRVKDLENIISRKSEYCNKSEKRINDLQDIVDDKELVIKQREAVIRSQDKRIMKLENKLKYIISSKG